MKIIGFAASPRKNGNTAWSVDKMEGAREQGSEVQAWCSCDLDIKPCQGCLACHQHGNQACVINDDMQKLYDALKHADALVLGSPVYMGQMSAQAKTFVDRLFAQINPRFSPHFKELAVRKKLFLVFTQGNPDPTMFQAYFDYTEHMFRLLEFDVSGVHVVAGMRNEPAHERKELHAAMKTIGASMGR